MKNAIYQNERKEVSTLKKVLATSIALLLFMTTGCSQTNEENHSEGHQQAAAPVIKYTMGSNDWTALEAYSPEDSMKEAYQFAVDHPEVLNYMPCYCGCYEEDGHTSNTHCFVDRVEDNVAILDNMGLG